MKIQPFSELEFPTDKFLDFFYLIKQIKYFDDDKLYLSATDTDISFSNGEGDTGFIMSFNFKRDHLEDSIFLDSEDNDDDFHHFIPSADITKFYDTIKTKVSKPYFKDTNLKINVASEKFSLGLHSPTYKLSYGIKTRQDSAKWQDHKKHLNQLLYADSSNYTLKYHFSSYDNLTKFFNLFTINSQTNDNSGHRLLNIQFDNLAGDKTNLILSTDYECNIFWNLTKFQFDIIKENIHVFKDRTLDYELDLVTPIIQLLKTQNIFNKCQAIVLQFTKTHLLKITIKLEYIDIHFLLAPIEADNDDN